MTAEPPAQPAAPVLKLVSTWTTDDDSYSPDKYYTRASDQRGHTKSVRVAIDPEIYAEITKMLYRGSIPEYSQPGDLIRDALRHRMKYLSEHQLRTTDMRKVVDRNLRLADLQAALATQERYEGQILDLDTTSARMRVQADWEGLVQVLNIGAEMLGELREPYHHRLVNVLVRYTRSLGNEWVQHLR